MNNIARKIAGNAQNRWNNDCVIFACVQSFEFIGKGLFVVGENLGGVHASDVASAEHVQINFGNFKSFVREIFFEIASKHRSIKIFQAFNPDDENFLLVGKVASVH